MTEHFDVLIVGAGISGVSAAYHLRKQCPDKTFAVLEARAAIGGTWDLFRYPGVRSDSDMFTLGFHWLPWSSEKALADGASIRSYLDRAARKAGVYERLRLQHRVTRADWSSESARYLLEVEIGEKRARARFSCNFLCLCSGYYDYAAGHAPHFEGIQDFAGRVVHPQFWPEDLAYDGKRVVVIGSGATAITMVPALAKRAAHVVMLQRSPTYVVSLPAVDPLARLAAAVLPARPAYELVRWRNVAMALGFFRFARARPELAKRILLSRVRAVLGPELVEQHFTPRYAVWDQRVCLIPDGDLFEALRDGRASVVTDRIVRFTRTGLSLQSGRELEADLIVTATGFELRVAGGLPIYVDGRPFEFNRSMGYRGCMFTELPNLALWFGYTNASWTLKADLTSEYICRVLRELDARGAASCTPRRADSSVDEVPWLDFSSGFVQRALDHMPKQGSKRPFKLYQNYVLDLLMQRYAPIDDGVLEFAPGPSARRSSVEGSDSTGDSSEEEQRAQ